MKQPINSIWAPSTDGMALAVRRLKDGELVGFPTETVYGLGADASNARAVVKIFELKQRPANHPVIVHLAPNADLEKWVRRVPPAARALIDKFAPGPLTLILPKGDSVPDVVTGGQKNVGLRFPAHPVAQRLLRDFGGGIAAPSANRFGRVSATTAQHVADEFGDDKPMILDGGPCQIGIESTIVDLTRGAAVLLRPGAISPRELAEALGYMPLAGSRKSPRVSGSLESHYAPKTESRLVKPFELGGAIRTAAMSGRRLGVLARIAVKPADFDGIWRQAGPEWTLYARALYAELRLLDAAGVDLILIEEPPVAVDWQAVNDRLHRATTHVGIKPGTRGTRTRKS
jgi:L-threonylcarbamoyladenylate synthase